MLSRICGVYAQMLCGDEVVKRVTMHDWVSHANRRFVSEAASPPIQLRALQCNSLIAG